MDPNFGSEAFAAFMLLIGVFIVCAAKYQALIRFGGLRSKTTTILNVICYICLLACLALELTINVLAEKIHMPKEWILPAITIAALFCWAMASKRRDKHKPNALIGYNLHDQ